MYTLRDRAEVRNDLMLAVFVGGPRDGCGSWIPRDSTEWRVAEQESAPVVFRLETQPPDVVGPAFRVARYCRQEFSWGVDSQVVIFIFAGME